MSYEYKTVKLPPARGTKADRRKRDRILNELGADGWELEESTPKSALAFGRKDSATLRRPTVSRA